MKLQRAKGLPPVWKKTRVQHLFNFGSGLIDKDSYLTNPGRKLSENRLRLGGRDITVAGRIEIKTQRIGAVLYRLRGIFQIRYAANLDLNHIT